jgi:hypothetical protein
MTEEEAGPAPTVAFGEQPTTSEQSAAGEAVSGVGVPHRSGYMESPLRVREGAAEEGVAPPQRVKLSEE